MQIGEGGKARCRLTKLVGELVGAGRGTQRGHTQPAVLAGGRLLRSGPESHNHGVPRKLQQGAAGAEGSRHIAACMAPEPHMFLLKPLTTSTLIQSDI